MPLVRFTMLKLDFGIDNKWCALQYLLCKSFCSMLFLYPFASNKERVSFCWSNSINSTTSTVCRHLYPLIQVWNPLITVWMYFVFLTCILLIFRAFVIAFMFVLCILCFQYISMSWLHGKFAFVIVETIFLQNRVRNPSMAGVYPQQGYQARPPTSWAPPGAPQMQQPGYGYGQPGSYSGPSPQYNMSQPSYPGYPQPSSGGYPSNWDQSTMPPTHQSTQGSGYDYYGQQPPPHQQQNPGGPAAPSDNTGYNYSQPPASGYQQGQGYVQDGYGGYHAASQSGYGQPPTYDQQQGYSAPPSYGNVTNPTQDVHSSSYGSQGDSTQVPPVQPSSVGQQGYGSSQQPSPNPAGYPPQGANQAGYGSQPPAQPGYGSQPPAQPGYGPGYGAPQTQKASANPPVYGQATQSPSTPGGYGQPAAQPGYTHSQPPPANYAQPDSGPQRGPPSSYSAGVSQPGYGPPPYGAPPGSQGSYGQVPPYNASYGSGYSQPPPYSGDGNASGNTRGGYDAAPTSQNAQQGGVAKSSPQS